MTCRFYKSQFPSINDNVMVVVNTINDNGIYVSLLEYGKIEGLISISELSHRRIKSIHKIVRIGGIYCVNVINVDNDKGYVDLSKRRVSPEDRKKCEDKYNDAKIVDGILKYVSSQLELDQEDLYSKIIWKYSEFDGYDVLKKINCSIITLDTTEIGEHVISLLKSSICRRLASQVIKFRADFEINCFTKNGIESIKKALKTGITEHVHINLIASPLFAITASTNNEHNEGAIVNMINHSLQLIENSIIECGGTFKLIVPPRSGDIEIKKEEEDIENENMSEENLECADE